MRRDFADLFEVKSQVRDRSGDIEIERGADDPTLRFRYEVPGFSRETTVRVERSEIGDADGGVVAQAPARVEGDDWCGTSSSRPGPCSSTVVRVGCS